MSDTTWWLLKFGANIGQHIKIEPFTVLLHNCQLEFSFGLPLDNPLSDPRVLGWKECAQSTIHGSRVAVSESLVVSEMVFVPVHESFMTHNLFAPADLATIGQYIYMYIYMYIYIQRIIHFIYVYNTSRFLKSVCCSRASQCSTWLRPFWDNWQRHHGSDICGILHTAQPHCRSEVFETSKTHQVDNHGQSHWLAARYENIWKMELASLQLGNHCTGVLARRA